MIKCLWYMNSDFSSIQFFNCDIVCYTNLNGEICNFSKQRKINFSFTFYSSLIRSDSCTFDTNVMPFDSHCSINSNLILSGVPIIQTQVIVSTFYIQIRKDQLKNRNVIDCTLCLFQYEKKVYIQYKNTFRGSLFSFLKQCSF